MFEVEKGFILTPKQEKSLIEGAEFLGEKKITDTYYDDENYSLTGNDIWFRKRNGNFELKIPMNVSIEERVSDQYKEIENEQDILNYFKSNKKTMAELLQEKEFKPFCTIITTRKKYKKDGFNIDFDETDFGYNCMEIEHMVEDESKMKESTESIIEFAKNHGITEGDRWGKVVEFIKRSNPAHFQALLDAKIIK